LPRERVRPGKRWPDRIYRGRILKEIQKAGGEVLIRDLGPLIDAHYVERDDEEWVATMVARLERDGLVRICKHRARLP